MFPKTAITLLACLFMLQGGRLVDNLAPNTDKKVRKLLKRGIPGDRMLFDLAGNPACNLSELKYIGETNPGNKESVKVLSSFLVTGRSCRGTSRVILFDANNRKLGNFYLGMPENLPDSLTRGWLFFPPTCPETIAPYAIDLSQEIPDQIILPCEGAFTFEKE